ncbi:LysR family transcriptional regulator [Ectobacillus panaciterrae]|uniref:LysR family transcriptional regulator n=1 Tax=Ectobacillus panaciterrae TaxID=363872 RepID=UPI00040C05F1|nr:LysR family transcriptional regulator [Ectobacillus panaciterrae]
MSLAKYEVFNTVVELGNLTKAAEALNLTQSAVSYSIANLESELGFSLLIRSRSGITLTSNGQRILRYIRTILHWNEKMKQEAASINGLEVGTVRIGAFTSVCIQWLPRCMKHFKQEHPSIEIKILQGGYQDIEQWITNGVVDFGFVTLPTLEGFETIPLKEDRLVCILPYNHPLGNQDKIRMEQLENESFIIQKSGYDHDIKRIFKETRVTLKNKFEMADDQAIIALVENELGVSVIPELVLQGLPHNVTILSLEPEQHRSIGIAVTSLKEISPAAKKFIECVKTLLRSN